MATKKNIINFADQGDKIQTLKALRHKLAETIEQSDSGRDIAALSRQLREVMEEIETLERETSNAKITALDRVRAKHGKES